MVKPCCIRQVFFLPKVASNDVKTSSGNVRFLLYPLGRPPLFAQMTNVPKRGYSRPVTLHSCCEADSRGLEAMIKLRHSVGSSESSRIYDNKSYRPLALQMHLWALQRNGYDEAAPGRSSEASEQIEISFSSLCAFLALSECISAHLCLVGFIRYVPFPRSSHSYSPSRSPALVLM